MTESPGPQDPTEPQPDTDRASAPLPWEAPEGDAVDQLIPVEPDAETPTGPLPPEADPADVADQLRSVDLGEEYEDV